MTSRPWHRLLEAVLLLPALYPIVWVLGVFWSRIDWPMDLDFMEGGQLYHAWRLLHGLPIYGPGEQGFLPYAYPPLHMFVLALAGGMFGLDYPVGRAVSIAFFLLACGVLARELWKASIWSRQAVFLVVTGLGTMAAGYGFTGAWYDVIKMDSMAMALVILAAALVAERPLSMRRVWCAALVMAAAFFTKQTTVVYLAWIGLFVLARDRREGVALGMGSSLFILAGLGALQLWSHGHFWTWNFGVMSKHVVHPGKFLIALAMDLRFAPWLLILPPAFGILALGRALSARTVLWCGVLACAIVASMLAFAKAGGYINNFLQVTFVAGPCGLLVAIDAWRVLEDEPGVRPRLRWAGLVICALYLVWLRTDLSSQIPSAEQWRNVRSLNATIAGLEGGVLMPSHPFLAIRNGHTTGQFHVIGHQDAMDAGIPGIDLPGYVHQVGARWVLLSGCESDLVRGIIASQYTLDHVLTETVSTLTGGRCTPRDLYQRNDRAAPQSFAPRP